MGADESLSIEVINYLKENRFLDEKRFVEAYVQGKVRIKKWGRQKIKAALYQKRIDAKLIQEGIYAFISDEEYQLVLESLIERKNRELSTEKNPQIKKQKLLEQRLFLILNFIFSLLVENFTQNYVLHL